MAKLEINGHVVEIDDGFLSMPADMQDKTVDEIARSLPAKVTRGEAISRSVAQGGSLSLGDEISAAAASAPGALGRSERFNQENAKALGLPSIPNPITALAGALFGDQGEYDKNLSETRGDLKTAREQYPISTAAGEIGGSLAVPLGAASSPLKAAKAAGTVGAIYGAGAGEGAEGRLAGGVVGGGIGAAAGAAAPFVTKAIGGAANAAGRALSAPVNAVRGLARPEEEAVRRVQSALARDGVENPAGRLAQMQAEGAPAVLGDVGGETTRALARSAANTSPEAREALTSATGERFASQGDRITDILKGFGPSNAGKTLDDLQDAARAANAPAYRAAYAKGAGGVITPDLIELLQAPAIQDAIKGIVKTGNNKAVADRLPPVRNPFAVDANGNLVPNGATPTLQFWDYVQRALSGREGELRRAGNNDAARDYTQLRKRLVAELDAAVPEFAAARRGAAQAFASEDALEAGQKFVTSRMSNDEARKAFARLKPEEKELFAEGFRSSLIDRIREIGDNRDVVKSIFASPAARERVSIALGPKQAGELEATLATERAMLALQNAMYNSTTARQWVELGLAGGTGGAVGFLQGGADGIAPGAVIGALTRRAGVKIDQNVAKRVGEILASGDIEAVQKVAKSAASSRKMLEFLDAVSDNLGKAAAVSSDARNSATRYLNGPALSSATQPASQESQTSQRP